MFSPITIATVKQHRLHKRGTVRLSNQRNLIHVPCKKVASSSKIYLKQAVLNVRSLNNKSFLINNLISSCNLDFMFLTETWLDTDTGNAVLIESSPPNYTFESETRKNLRGGGVCAIFRDNIVTNKVSLGVFSSFEYVSFKMELKQSSILFIIIYKPPQNCFIDDFTELLSVACTEFDCLVISGDLNVHVDVANDRHAKELSAILETFGLMQHVAEPTHNRGHTLDLVITKGVAISNVTVVDVALSDHFCVFFDLSVTPKPAAGPTVIQSRQINDKTRTQFVEMIRFDDTACSNVDNLLKCYTSSLLNVLDTIAPVKVRVVKNRQKAPWRNEDSVRAQKRLCRRPSGNGESQSSRFIMKSIEKSYAYSTRLYEEQGRIIFLI